MSMDFTKERNDREVDGRRGRRIIMKNVWQFRIGMIYTILRGPIAMRSTSIVTRKFGK
jgi:hypothetical protein